MPALAYKTAAHKVPDTLGESGGTIAFMLQVHRAAKESPSSVGEQADADDDKSEFAERLAAIRCMAPCRSVVSPPCPRAALSASRPMSRYTTPLQANPMR